MWPRPQPPPDTIRLWHDGDGVDTTMDAPDDDADERSLRYCWHFDGPLNDGVDGCRRSPSIARYLRRCTVR